jgi:antirestriction protein ArdC
VDTDQKAEKPELIENAERFFSATGAIIRHGGDQAYYSPGSDVIELPVPEAFRDAESYAATKALKGADAAKQKLSSNRPIRF